MTSPLKLVLPLAILALGGVATVGLVTASPQLDTEPPEHRAPSVRTIRTRLDSVTLRVHTQGTVVPRTESDLVAEVSGRIISVSPSLASGGFLELDDAVVMIDPSDYEIAVERAKASVARAESQLTLARSALSRQERLAKRKVASSADLEGARSRQQVAQAELRDAHAGLLQAERDLSRTAVRVPFAGRVREKKVDVGQYVNRGTPVARVYAVDYAEVRLPIPDRDAAFVDLPIDYRDAEGEGAGEGNGPVVLLRAMFAGREHTWQGHIVRTEGELDPKTRMIHAVARVEDPYGRSGTPNRPPLAVGLFVEAEIHGRELDDVIRLPRAALRGTDEVAIVGDDGRVEFRRVEVTRYDRNHVLIGAGLHANEQVISVPLAIAVDGMLVRAFEERDESVPGEGAPALGTDTLAALPEATPEAMEHSL